MVYLFKDVIINNELYINGNLEDDEIGYEILGKGNFLYPMFIVMFVISVFSSAVKLVLN